MILHLITDDKFSDSVVKQFFAKEMMSEFILLSYTDRMQYFHYSSHIYKIINPYKEFEMNQLLTYISNYSSVVFHGFYYPWQVWLLNRWPKHVKIAWVCWGGEIYGQPELQYSFLKPFSKFAFWIHLRKNDNNDGKIFPKNLIRTANYCLTNMKEEYDYVMNYLNSDMKHLSFNYYSINDTIGDLIDKRCRGNNIFLGNAATIESNHIEALIDLKKLGVEDRQIVIPLSYGSPWVRNMCIKIGKFLFKDKLLPIVNFLPLSEYNALMLSCSVMIQPHLREHAHGNIMTALWLGLRVYLSENGIDYKHFKSIGCKVYSIEQDLRRCNPNVFSPMTDEDVAYNRQVLLSVYGQEHINATNREIVKQLA